MIPSSPSHSLVEKPPDPLVSPSPDQSGGRRSSSRLAVNSRSRKGKEGKDSHLGEKHATGFEKLNLEDFIQGSELEQASKIQQEGSAMVVDLGLSYGDNGIAIATTPSSAIPEVDGSSPSGLQTSYGLQALDLSNSVHPLRQDSEFAAGAPVCEHCQVFGHSLKLCKRRPRSEEETKGPAQEAKDKNNNKGVGLNSAANVNTPDDEGFTIVTKKRRKLKLKVNGRRTQYRGAIPPKGEESKTVGVDQGDQPNTSSDPKIQTKMGELHNRFVAVQKPKRSALSAVTNNSGTHRKSMPSTLQPSIPNRFHSPKPTLNIPKPSLNPKPITQPNTRAFSSQPTAAVPDPRGVSTSNPFAVLDVEMCDFEKGKNVESIDCDIHESGFFELNAESIKNILKVNPNSLNVSRVHDMTTSIEDHSSDDDFYDFDITNGQKATISKSLEKFGSVKASDQANWSPGEWDYFHHLVESLDIDPNTCVEDVNSDSNGSALFLKSLNKEGMSGGVVLPGGEIESNKGERGTNRLFLGLKGMVWDRFIRRHEWAAGRLGPKGSLVPTTINGIYLCGINHYTFWPGSRFRKPSLEDCWLADSEVNQDSIQPILWAILAQFGWKSDVGTGNKFNVVWKPGWGRLIMLGTIDMLRRYGKVMGRVLLTHVIRKRENWVHHFTHYGLFFRVTRCNYLWLYIVPSFWLRGNPYPFSNLYVCSDSSRELPRSRIRLQFHPFLYSLGDDYQSNVRDFWGWEGCFLTRDRCHRWNSTVVM
ncbi:hypothetical protein L1987_04453 [Smallanthus sonchifolius]|uniref:Uncharacterized protein n=1 Tax=Smallanthus sonchifolius TaxID=185202 RepID=A0ACB9KDN0_9ASTR|nr:hypothetical protein L1987_04453 [Smallanthus sonchifolius]